MAGRHEIFFAGEPSEIFWIACFQVSSSVARARMRLLSAVGKDLISF